MNSKNEISILNLEPEVQIRRIIKVRDVEFEEEFLSELLSNYFSRKINGEFPKLSDALNIYLNESHSVILPFCKGARSRNVMQPWPVSASV